MGATIWADVEGRGAQDLPSDNSLMLILSEQLDGLSEKLGLPKLTTFHDYSDMEAEAEGLLGDEEDSSQDGALGETSDAVAPRGAWFEPAGALSAVRAIRQHLAKHPEDLRFTPDPSSAHWPALLMEELEHVQSVLERAAAGGHKFRFLAVS